MKSNELLLLILMPFIGLAPRQALSQSAVAMVNGRVMGLPNGNVASFQVMLVSDGAPCAVLQTHPLADGSFRFSSVRWRAGSSFQPCQSGCFHPDSNRSRATRRNPPRAAFCRARGERWSAPITVPHSSSQGGISFAGENRAHRGKCDFVYRP